MYPVTPSRITPVTPSRITPVTPSSITDTSTDPITNDSIHEEFLLYRLGWLKEKHETLVYKTIKKSKKSKKVESLKFKNLIKMKENCILVGS